MQGSCEEGLILLEGMRLMSHEITIGTKSGLFKASLEGQRSVRTSGFAEDQEQLVSPEADGHRGEECVRTSTTSPMIKNSANASPESMVARNRAHGL